MEAGVSNKKVVGVIRNVYLYMVTLIGLVTFVFGAVGIINNGLQRYVFKVDTYNIYTPVPFPGFKDECSSEYTDFNDPTLKKMITPTTQQIEDCRRIRDDQNVKMNNANFGREISISLAQILIGLPIWLLHWGVIQQDHRKKED